MRYLITLDTPSEVSSALTEKPEQMLKTMEEIMAQLKPEATYFSTTRRYSIFVADIADPHVQLRKVFETFSKFGKVTVDPVSTLDEFLRFWKNNLQVRFNLNPQT
jgi:hypothetical protein